jgi:hypothetical protein
LRLCIYGDIKDFIMTRAHQRLGAVEVGLVDVVDCRRRAHEAVGAQRAVAAERRLELRREKGDALRDGGGDVRAQRVAERRSARAQLGLAAVSERC